MRRRPRLALLVVPAVLAAAACSDSDDAPVASISDQVARAVAKQLDLPAGEVEASCPRDAKAETASRFVCDLVVDGQDVQAGVAFTSDEQFGFELAAEVRPKAELEGQVRDELALRFPGIDVATVDCGGGDLVVVVAAGATVECHAEDTVGGQATAVVGLDAEGHAAIQSVTDPAAPVPE